MPWSLHIDDQYDDPELIFRHPPEGFTPAKTVAEAIELTEHLGLPEYISFDHDLGNGHDAIEYCDYLIHNYYEEEVPKYGIHSANPVGTANIISKMESWRKSKLL